MQRDAWDFALVSAAGCKRQDGDVRIVLGGVAPRPWRVNISVEEDVSSGGLDEEAIATLAERALYDAKPMSKNGYKVDLAASLLRQAIGEIVIMPWLAFGMMTRELRDGEIIVGVGAGRGLAGDDGRLDAAALLARHAADARSPFAPARRTTWSP